MSRFYTVPFEAVAVTAAQDFWEIQPADDKPIAIHGLILSQSSDTGDAAEEMLRLTFTRVPATFTSGSGGTSVTPVTVDPSGAAAGFTAECNNTTIATTSGTLVVAAAYQFNIRTGLEMYFPPELQIGATQATPIVVRLMAAPADSLTMSGTLFVREDG